MLQLCAFSAVLLLCNSLFYSLYEHPHIGWHAVIIGVYTAWLILKRRVLLKPTDEPRPPIMYLGFEGGFFFIALILVAVVMIGFAPLKRVYLPPILGYFIAYLVFEVLGFTRRLRRDAQ